MRTQFFLYILMLGLTNLVRAQDHKHLDNHHSHYGNEIAISNNLVFLGTDREFAYGIHLHYVHNFGETKFGAGLGYERIFDEHGHNSISIAGSYRPFHEFVILLSPGITFEDHWDRQVELSIHIETGYEFEIKHLHFGPVLGFAYIPGDYHLSMGLHLGYGF